MTESQSIVLTRVQLCAAAKTTAILAVLCAEALASPVLYVCCPRVAAPVVLAVAGLSCLAVRACLPAPPVPAAGDGKESAMSDWTVFGALFLCASILAVGLGVLFPDIATYKMDWLDAMFQTLVSFALVPLIVGLVSGLCQNGVPLVVRGVSALYRAMLPTCAPR